MQKTHCLDLTASTSADISECCNSQLEVSKTSCFRSSKMLDHVAFVRPVSVEPELRDVREPEAVNPNLLTGDEAQSFYESLVGVPSAEYPKPNIAVCTAGTSQCDSSDEEEEEEVSAPKEKSEFAKTLFLHAQNGECRQLKRLLVLKKFDVNMQDVYGWTPLHCAAFGGHLSCIKTLLTFGAKKELTDNKGRTALELARKSKNHSAYHIIKHYGETKECQPEPNLPEPEIVLCQSCKTEFDANKWEQHLASIVHRAAQQVDQEPTYGIPQANKGFQMLESMGWEKEMGLGPDGSGRKFPIKTKLKRDRQGLGLLNKEGKVTHFSQKELWAVKHNTEPNTDGKLKKRILRKTSKDKILEKEFRRAFY